MLISIIILLSFSGCEVERLSNNDEAVVTISSNEITVYIENTKNIDIYDVLSSDSNNNVNIVDSEKIKELESLFNKSVYTESTERIESPSLYVKFRSDKEELSFFVYANDIVDIDGIKYKSSEAIFEKIKTLISNE